LKKIVPLNKNITFKNNLAEITSIALDHDLELIDRVIKGSLVISGSYKMNDVSINTEEFKYNIPVNIEMSERYILDDLTIDISDFYYEIINNNILSINIEIALDKLKEEIIPPMKYDEEKIEKVSTIEKIENIKIENDKKEELPRVNTDDVKTLFDNFDESTETYTTYKICILKENDTVDSVTLKYGITRELLEQYNDLSDLKIGDKLIIPAIFDETN